MEALSQLQKGELKETLSRAKIFLKKREIMCLVFWVLELQGFNPGGGSE